MEEIRSFFMSLDYIGIAAKAIALIFSVGYFFYAIIFFQRLIKLHRTYTEPSTHTLFAFSWLQLSIGGILLLYALFLL